MATYGRTWWGKQWLEAFNGIGGSNRLARGKSYANVGRTKEISISGTTIFARVQGSRPRPYKVAVKLNGLTKTEKKKIHGIIANSPTIIAQLVNKQLSESLLGLLKEQNIDLFPTNWKDLTAECNCPDYAVPCKHIAALIYIMAAEIDKDPFMAFKINDCDLMEMIGDFGDGKLASAQKVPSLADILVPYSGKENVFDQSVLDTIDLAHIPYLAEQICTILPNNPLFYEKNFRDILHSAYKHWQRTTFPKGLDLVANSKDEISEEKLFAKKWGNIETWQTINIEFDELFQAIEVNHGSGPCFSKKTGYALPALLADIPNSMLHKLNPELRVLHMINQFAQKLLIHGAIIPQITHNKNGLHFIRWVPALFDPKVCELFEKLTSICPKGLVTWNKHNLSPEAQVKAVIAILIDWYLNENLPKSFDSHKLSKVFAIFFLGQIHPFSNKSTPETINLWLSRLYVSEKTHKLYLLVSDAHEQFTLDVHISVGQEQSPVSIQKALPKIEPKDKLSILSDLALLTEYIPKLTPLIDAGQKPVFELDEFGPLFLHSLPLLRALGITIILPKSLQKIMKPSLSLNLKAQDKVAVDRESFMNLDEMLSFDWQIAIGDKTLSAAAFKKLLKDSRGLVKIMDQFVLLDEKEIASLLKRLDTLPERLEQNELMQAALSGSLFEAEVHLDKQLSTLFSKLHNYKSVSVPKTLNAVLRPYQERGFSWLVQNIEIGFGSILADDMGLGKTLQVIAAIVYCKQAGFLKKEKVLIVAPTSLLTNWQREIERFAPELKACIYHGQARKFADEYDIVITSYGLARRDKKLFDSIGWFLLVIDEAQNIKNPGTEQTKVIKSLKAKHRIAMSGTPVENRLLEYWSIFDFANKSYLGTAKQFSTQFARPIEQDRDKDRLEQFGKITSPFILRRLKSDKTIIQDLPDKVETNRFCALTAEQTALYKEVVDMTLKKIEHSEGIERKGLVFKLINALKQICNHPSQYAKKKTVLVDQSGKMQALDELMAGIDELAEKTLIFTQYTEMGQMISQVLEERYSLPVPFLHGGLSRKQRDQMVNDFQNTPQVRTLVISLKAGGTGLNLTAATHVIHYDLWWNPAVEAQATDRAYRIGQKRNVMVHRLITSGTFEEKIDAMIQSKKELANLTVESGEQWVTELDNNQLRDLVAIRNA